MKTNRLKDNSTEGEQKALNYPREMIISSINCHTYKISKYVDHYLQPVMKEIPSYVKDTNDFINKINNHNIPRVNIYLTWYKISLYKHTKPRRDSSCRNVPWTLSTQSSSNKGHNYFLALILTLNNFKFYLQIKVHAMSTVCAPTLCKCIYGLLQREIPLPIN